MDKLKPCPFCGKMPAINEFKQVHCSNKDCDETYILEVWNHRSVEDALVEALEWIESNGRRVFSSSTGDVDWYAEQCETKARAALVLAECEVSHG